MPALPAHSPVVIRPAAPADFPGWLEMAAAVRPDFPGMSPSDHQYVMKRCITRKTAFCACVRGVMAGGTAFSPTHGGIGFLAVRPEYRRRGIGALLVREALSRMPTGRAVFVHVYPGASAARALYLSLGFRENGFIRHEGQAYQTMLLSSERLGDAMCRNRNFPAANGSL